MDITGSHDQFIEFLTKLTDTSVNILQFFDGVDRLLLTSKHEFVISKRLDLQIIIKLHQPYDLLLWSSSDYRTI